MTLNLLSKGINTLQALNMSLLCTLTPVGKIPVLNRHPHNLNRTLCDPLDVRIAVSSILFDPPLVTVTTPIKCGCLFLPKATGRGKQNKLTLKAPSKKAPPLTTK